MKCKKQGNHLGYIQKAVANIKDKNKPLNPATVMSDGMIECSNGGESYVISGAEAVAAFRGLTSNLSSQPEWRGKFSEKYISTELRKILAGLSTGTPASLSPRLEEFIRCLQEFKGICELVIPIQGLKLEVKGFFILVASHLGLPIRSSSINSARELRKQSKLLSVLTKTRNTGATIAEK
jgi:hypothetical protein